ncbi:MAG TPA: protein kinase [Gemmatimonadaceae bacterium]
MSSVPTPIKSESVATEERAAQELLERLRKATLGTYDIHSELGRGGMATVYLAHEISLDRKVAIKVMSPAMLHGAGMVERFKREARTAAGLSHPNIIPIYAVHEIDGLLFCVIKLVEGTPLDSVMRELGQLPVPMVHGILAQVGGALGYAHRHGVVHRDIKPGNILIDDEGWAVVTDFGIAKVTESEGLTSTGMAIGTPTYMSPEQATADGVTGASDQYSLGVVAYEMLTGRPPFTGTSMMALMYSHFHDDPPSIRLFRPDVPDQLCDAVMRMLRKDPAARWSSMEEAVAAAGARPLQHDDPSRSQLIALAKTGLTHRIVSQAQTPRSPVPRAARGAAARVARNPMLLVAAAAGFIVVGFLGAKIMSDSRQPGLALAPETAGPPKVTAESVSVPAPTPSVAKAPENAVKANVQPPSNQRVVEPPPTRRDPVVAGIGAPAGDSNRSTVSQRAESSGAPVQQKAETTRSLPPVEPPPVSAASTSPQTPPSSVPRPTVDPATEVTAVIQSYARALAGSDLALARRVYAGMPADQREGLEALWREGGTMTPSWSVTDIAITGDVATARVRGSNVVTTRRGQTSTVPVSLRARLERRGGEWRLVALVN